MKSIHNLLKIAAEAYYNGNPIMSNASFDFLAEKYNYTEIGHIVSGKKDSHLYKVYSLQKVFNDTRNTLFNEKDYTITKTPKLDGAAISLLYDCGYLIRALTRGDGVEGEIITTNIYSSSIVPKRIKSLELMQITGEVLVSKDIDNARNYAAGTIRLKNYKEVLRRSKEVNLTFVAYGVQPYISDSYTEDMNWLQTLGFLTVIDDKNIFNNFEQDGTVYRIDNYIAFENLGYTNAHPRGAYAFKKREDVSIEETTLLDVHWQVGASGQVTPVAEFEEVIIDGARITRATLHNPAFIEEMELDIGDTILVTRSGKVIPKVVGKV